MEEYDAGAWSAGILRSRPGGSGRPWRVSSLRTASYGAPWLSSEFGNAPCKGRTQIYADRTPIAADRPPGRASRSEAVLYTSKVLALLGTTSGGIPGVRSLHVHGEISEDRCSLSADLRFPMTRSRTKLGDEPRWAMTRK